MHYFKKEEIGIHEFKNLEDLFFSVIIPTFERPTDLQKALIALSPKIQKTAQPYEVIVSDDSNDQKSRGLIMSEFEGIAWTKGKKKWASRESKLWGHALKRYLVNFYR